jgi:hypothetical protein
VRAQPAVGQRRRQDRGEGQAGDQQRLHEGDRAEPEGHRLQGHAADVREAAEQPDGALREGDEQPRAGGRRD